VALWILERGTGASSFNLQSEENMMHQSTTLIRRGVAIFVLAIGCGLSQGCAFVDNTIELSYEPSVSGYKGTATIEIVKPNLSLVKKKGMAVVGYVRNGYQHHTADVLTTTDVADWIVLALSKELQGAGYDVRTVSALSRSHIGLKTDVEHLLADIESFRLTATVRLVISVYDGDELLNRITAGGEGSWLSTRSSAESYMRSLEVALQNTMKEAIPKIVIASEGGLE
jgi:hypothetical protein